MKKTIITLIGLALFAAASVAGAQSTVTGTLSSGNSGSTTLSGTVTGSSNNTLSGTVVSPPGTGTSGGSSGGGGTGSGSNVVDICPNIDGVQPTLTGYVMQNGLCVAAAAGTGGTRGGAVLGTETETPNVPNAGAGTDAAALLALALSALLAAGGAGYYFRWRRV